MGTGACGIDCEVCRLKVRGLCSPCGAATSADAAAKLEAQYRIFRGECPVLRCARDHGIPYCMRDCSRFPCEIFERGPYPFSKGFLSMQKRRRMEHRPPTAALKSMLQWKDEEVDPSHWKELERMVPGEVCRRALVTFDAGAGAYRIPFLNSLYSVFPFRRSVSAGRPETCDAFHHDEASFAEALVLVLYLLKAQDLPLSGKQQTERELPGGGTFFQGPHELPREPILKRFGRDAGAFLEAGMRLGGQRHPYGDAAFRLQALPRIPIDYILWAEDDEFPARLTVTFDSTAAEHLPLDALWALVHVVTARLIESGIPSASPR